MSDVGFWRIAASAPEHVALVTPDGRSVKAGVLLARANRLVHGLRRLGLTNGDAIAVVLPNGAAMIELYLAATQAGWYLVPINHHLTAAEIAYIIDDSGAKVLVADERFAAASRAAADEIRFPTGACFAVGSIPGFQPYAALTDGVPSDPPAERTAGAVMNYTSGTTGRPKGVRRRLMPVEPETMASMVSMLLAMFGIEYGGDGVHLVGSPLYHTAPLVFAGVSLHIGHTLVLMDKWSPAESLAVMARHRVTTSHMVPTQFHRLLALPDEVKRRHDLSSLRHMIHAAAPCPST